MSPDRLQIINMVRKSHAVSQTIVIKAFLSDKRGGSRIPRITMGNKGIDSPNIVGIVRKRNCPPPFIRSTKKIISSKARTPVRILLVSLRCSVIRGTAVSAAISSMEGTITENTPSPMPEDTDTRKVMMLASGDFRHSESD